jgi:hypothetical protein
VAAPGVEHHGSADADRRERDPRADARVPPVEARAGGALDDANLCRCGTGVARRLGRTIRIGTEGAQKRAFLAGVSGRSISGTATPVLVNGKGQLGTAGSRITGAPRLLSAAAGRRLLDEVRRQRRQIRRLRQRVFGSG